MTSKKQPSYAERFIEECRSRRAVADAQRAQARKETASRWGLVVAAVLVTLIASFAFIITRPVDFALDCGGGAGGDIAFTHREVNVVNDAWGALGFAMSDVQLTDTNDTRINVPDFDSAHFRNVQMHCKVAAQAPVYGALLGSMT